MIKNQIRLVVLIVALVYSGCKMQSTDNSKNESKPTILPTKDSLQVLDEMVYCDSCAQLLYDGKCSYTLSAINGWAAISGGYTGGGNSEVLVRYEPINRNQYSNHVHVYSYVVYKEFLEDSSLIGYLDLCSEYSVSRGEIVKDLEPIKLSNGTEAIVKYYNAESESLVFATAYIDEPEYIIIVTLGAHNPADFENSFQDFQKIVATYRYLGMVVLGG